jgi:hypothetical protein
MPTTMNNAAQLAITSGGYRRSTSMATLKEKSDRKKIKKITVKGLRG